MDTLTISGTELKVDDVVAVARDGHSVTLDEAILPRLQRSRAAVEQLVREERVVYGITTGFGRFKDKIISPTETKQGLTAACFLQNQAKGVVAAGRARLPFSSTSWRTLKRPSPK
jgi:histidine ammonia-lyase